jgi:hypothetical protein
MWHFISTHEENQSQYEVVDKNTKGKTMESLQEEIKKVYTNADLLSKARENGTTKATSNVGLSHSPLSQTTKIGQRKRSGLATVIMKVDTSSVLGNPFVFFGLFYTALFIMFVCSTPGNIFYTERSNGDARKINIPSCAIASLILYFVMAISGRFVAKRFLWE